MSVLSNIGWEGGGRGPGGGITTISGLVSADINWVDLEKHKPSTFPSLFYNSLEHRPSGENINSLLALNLTTNLTLTLMNVILLSTLSQRGEESRINSENTRLHCQC